MRMFDDFYDDSSEIEALTEEFKDSLLKSVKEEFLDEMDRLRKENAELKEFKLKKVEYDFQLRELKHSKELEIEQIRKEAEKKRLMDVLKDNFMETAYYPQYTWKYKYDKCDKCDERRYIHFKSPLGHDLSEPCSCSEKISYWKPEECSIALIRSEFDSLIFRYDEINNCFIALKSDNKEYEFGSKIYRTIEECQEECDRLNKENENEQN